jgi:hypothetical protein
LDAVARFDLPEVRRCLSHDPDLRELIAPGGLNLLQCASRRVTAGEPVRARQQVRLAQWLVSQGFDPTVTHTTAAGDDGEENPSQVSLVWFAVAKARNNPLAKYFLEQGSSPSALFAAAWWANFEIVPALVAHGEDINRFVGGTPLHLATAVLDRRLDGQSAPPRRLKMLRVLLDHGANPNIKDAQGSTVLHTALRKGYDPAVLSLLIRHSADPDIPGPDGRTARAIARRKKDRRYRAVVG